MTVCPDPPVCTRAVDAEALCCQDCSEQCDSRYGCKGPISQRVVRCVDCDLSRCVCRAVPLGLTWSTPLDPASRAIHSVTVLTTVVPLLPQCHTWQSTSHRDTAPPLPTRLGTVWRRPPPRVYQHNLSLLACHRIVVRVCRTRLPHNVLDVLVHTRYSNGSQLCVPTCDTSLHYQDLDGVCQPCHHLWPRRWLLGTDSW